MNPETTELAVIEKPEVKLSSAASLEEVGARLALVKRALKECMDKGVDYDQIPGCGTKDVLLKPGAEKLKTLFQLGFTVKDKEVRDLGEGHREVEITLTFTHLPTGWVMGDGVGSANTRERRMKREAGTPYDVYNNVLKIAKKRALVDGILSVTGSSGLLTQDVDEDPELYQKGKAQKPANGNGNGNGHRASGKLEQVTGHVSRTWPNDFQGKRYYFAKLGDGRQIQTLDEALGEQLLQMQTGSAFDAWCEPSPKPGKLYLKRFVEPEPPKQEQVRVPNDDEIPMDAFEPYEATP